MGKPEEDGGFMMGISGIYLLAMTNIAIENGHRHGELSR